MDRDPLGCLYRRGGQAAAQDWAEGAAWWGVLQRHLQEKKAVGDAGLQAGRLRVHRGQGPPGLRGCGARVTKRESQDPAGGSLPAACLSSWCPLATRRALYPGALGGQLSSRTDAAGMRRPPKDGAELVWGAEFRGAELEHLHPFRCHSGPHPRLFGSGERVKRLRPASAALRKEHLREAGWQGTTGLGIDRGLQERDGGSTPWWSGAASARRRRASCGSPIAPPLCGAHPVGESWK